MEIKLTIGAVDETRRNVKALRDFFNSEFPVEEEKARESIYFLDEDKTSFLVISDRITFWQKDFDVNSDAFATLKRAVCMITTEVPVVCTVSNSAPRWFAAQVAAELPCIVEFPNGTIKNSFSDGLHIEYREGNGCIAAIAPTLEEMSKLLAARQDVVDYISTLEEDSFTKHLESSKLRANSTSLPNGDNVIVFGPPISEYYCCFVRNGKEDTV